MLYFAIILYLIISAFALRLQVEKRDDYFDIRNIFVALLWWLFLLLAWVASKINDKPETDSNE